MTQKTGGRRLRTDCNVFIGGKIHKDAADAFNRLTKTLPNYTRQVILSCALLLLEAERKRRKILPTDDLEARLDLLT
jgi:hypothetical protein